MILDGSDATAGSTALSAATLIGQAFATRILEQRILESGRGAPRDLRWRCAHRFGTTPISSRLTSHTGVIGMILYYITAITDGHGGRAERERGTIEQLIVTPIRSWELILGKILPMCCSRSWT